tara:strand:- start:202 stop:327 length:126 start_codon:yes stop_codon:yes gene_type:complete
MEINNPCAWIVSGARPLPELIDVGLPALTTAAKGWLMELGG